LIGLNDMTAGAIVRLEQTTDPMCFSTPSGPVGANSTLPQQGMALVEEINPYVMESTPRGPFHWAPLHVAWILLQLAIGEGSVLYEANRETDPS
jgi:hypothetical protein